MLKQLRYLPSLLRRLNQVVDFARRESAHGEHSARRMIYQVANKLTGWKQLPGGPELQAECQKAVEGAINQLGERLQRDSLCLILNRYSAFCASPFIAIDSFPLT